jgi:hypothetical protein
MPHSPSARAGSPRDEELSTRPEVPAAFKDWTEHKDQPATLRVWSPGIVHGLLQTEALLST